jgi:hypothetical protein
VHIFFALFVFKFWKLSINVDTASRSVHQYLFSILQNPWYTPVPLKTGADAPGNCFGTSNDGPANLDRANLLG